MKRYARDKSDPLVKPVEKIELSEKNLRLRAVFAIIFFVIGITAIGFGVKSCLEGNSGWQIIEIPQSKDSLASELTVMYNPGHGDKSIASERKAVNLLCTSAMKDACLMFDPFCEGGYITAINTSQGQPVKVPGRLYAAFEEMEKSGSRLLYYGPYYEILYQTLGAGDDYSASVTDPGMSAETRELFDKISVYVNNDNAVKLQLLENDTVKLGLSAAYAQFARENGIDVFIDFGWLKNAFAVDLVADALTDGGYTNGFVSSCDGFSRYLNGKEYTYDVTLYKNVDGGPAEAARFGIGQIASGVLFHNMKLNSIEGVYRYGDGKTVTLYTDKDGSQAAAADSMYVYSSSLSCSQTALYGADAYLRKQPDTATVRSIGEKGVKTAYLSGNTVFCLPTPDGGIQLADGYEVKTVE